MPNTSTIQVSEDTKSKLLGLQNYPTESYEKILRRVLEYMQADDDEILSEDDFDAMEKSLKQLKEGKFKSLSEIRKKSKK